MKRLAIAPFGRARTGNGTNNWHFSHAGRDEAVARLLYVIEQRRPCAFLTGETGTGKSELLRSLVSEPACSRSERIFVDLTGMTSPEAIWHVAAGFGLGPHVDAAPIVLWRSVLDHLDGSRALGKHALLVFDHLDRADIECGLLIDRLVHCNRQSPYGLTVIAATSQSSLLVRELSEIRIELNPLPRETARDFVAHRIGATPDEIDLPDCLNRASGGDPDVYDLRRLDQLCELLNLVSESDAATRADSATLECVARELLPRAS